MRIRSLQDFVAGLTLVGVALFALWASAPLVRAGSVRWGQA
jgi:hypothetical protein